jgi:hypothetical protein
MAAYLHRTYLKRERLHATARTRSSSVVIQLEGLNGGQIGNSPDLALHSLSERNSALPGGATSWVCAARFHEIARNSCDSKQFIACCCGERLALADARSLPAIVEGV